MTNAVTNWAADYDIFDPSYVADPFAVWDDLRARCPIAHTERYGGSWLPTRMADVTEIARDIEHFSSREITVVPSDADRDVLPAGVPPIQADPPVHTWTRRLLLPWFSHSRIATYEPYTRALCNQLIDGFIETGNADAAADYAQQIPVRVIGRILGVPEDMSDTFTGWVRSILEFAHDEQRRVAARDEAVVYFIGEMEQRRGGDGDDLISTLLRAEVDGEKVSDEFILGIVALTLIAGADTTWSALGSSLWHLATHDEDRFRLASDLTLLPVAVEEFLRAYSPVTMARIVAEDTEIAGCPMQAGERVLMNFPAANRDPEAFENPDVVQLDRVLNRHVAFGSGIHRCAGSNLARMELQVAIEVWLTRLPEFRIRTGAEVRWAGGQVRGPRRLPVVFR
jgi:cytochrome P450